MLTVYLDSPFLISLWISLTFIFNHGISFLISPLDFSNVYFQSWDLILYFPFVFFSRLFSIMGSQFLISPLDFSNVYLQSWDLNSLFPLRISLTFIFNHGISFLISPSDFSNVYFQSWDLNS